MENSSKALLMAGGVLLALLVLSLLVLGYNSLTGYMSSDSENRKVEQLTKFNSEYEAYARTGVRGNELLTLMNKIIDYNAREADNKDIAYERMIISIDIGDSNIGQFRYGKATGITDIVYSNYNNSSNDNGLITTSNAVKDLTTTYGVSEAQLQKLSNNIANIFVEEENYPTNLLNQYQDNRESLLKTILGKKITTSSNPLNIAKVKIASAQYYEFTKFKQAYFDCDTKNMIYNKNSGRITTLKFKFKGFYDS